MALINFICALWRRWVLPRFLIFIVSLTSRLSRRVCVIVAMNVHTLLSWQDFITFPRRCLASKSTFYDISFLGLSVHTHTRCGIVWH